MDPITFTDNLIHYKNKLCETQEYIREASGLINSSLDVTGSSWKGSGAEACRIKLEDLKPEIEKAREALQHAENLLSQIESITIPMI